MGEVVRLPNVVLRTVAKPIGRGQPPGRKSNEEHGRTREWLSEAEIEKVMATAASHGRYGHRDSTLILMAYRHALRVSELVWLRWSQIDLKGGKVAVPRAKNGIASVHPLTGRELRVLRRLQREQSPGTEFLFMSQRGAPMAPAAAQKA